MQKLLELDACAWDLQQIVAAENSAMPQFRLDRVLKDKIFEEMLAESGKLLQSEVWQFLTANNIINHEIQQNILRAASIIYQLCVVPFRTWPYKLFSIIDDNTQACELLTAPACCIDTFTLQFKALFPDLAAMQSDDAKAYLLSILAEISGTTYSAERLHSHNLRYTKSRVQTHTVTLPFLAARHQSYACKPWQKDLLQRQLTQKGRKKTQAATQQCADSLPIDVDEDDTTQPPLGPRPVTANPMQPRPKVRRTGGGGAWRAFLHEERGKHIGMTVTELSAKYRNLSAEEMASLVERGKRAAAAHRANVPSFMTRKETAKLQKRQLLGGASLPALPVSTAALQPLLEEALTHTGPGDEDWRAAQHAVASTTITQASVRVHSLENEITSLSQMARAARGEKKIRTASLAQQGKCCSQAMVTRMPQHVVQMDGVTHFGYKTWCPTLACAITCKGACDHDNERQTARQRQALWEQEHLGSRASEFANIQEEKLKPLTQCQLAEKCVCRGPGRILNRLHTQMFAAIKALCPPGPRLKKLMSGQVIFQWLPQHLEAPRSSDSREASELQDIYTFVPLMYLTPWRPTFLLLRRSGQSTFQAVIHPNHAPHFLTTYELIAQLDSSLRWNLSVLFLDSDVDEHVQLWGHFVVQPQNGKAGLKGNG
eukprot:1310632-Amphidinium_carterae.1